MSQTIRGQGGHLFSRSAQKTKKIDRGRWLLASYCWDQFQGTVPCLIQTFQLEYPSVLLRFSFLLSFRNSVQQFQRGSRKCEKTMDDRRTDDRGRTMHDCNSALEPSDSAALTTFKICLLETIPNDLYYLKDRLARTMQKWQGNHSHSISDKICYQCVVWRFHRVFVF